MIERAGFVVHRRPVHRFQATGDAPGFALFDFALVGGRPRDQRLRICDTVFVWRGSPLAEDVWSANVRHHLCTSALNDYRPKAIDSWRD